MREGRLISGLFELFIHFGIPILKMGRNSLKFIDKRGRASGAEFVFLVFAAILSVGFVLPIIFAIIIFLITLFFPALFTFLLIIFGTILGFLGVMAILVTLSAIIRRLHDIGFSGLWLPVVLALLVVTYGLLLIPLLTWPGEKNNKYGPQVNGTLFNFNDALKNFIYYKYFSKNPNLMSGRFFNLFPPEFDQELNEEYNKMMMQKYAKNFPKDILLILNNIYEDERCDAEIYFENLQKEKEKKLSNLDFEKGLPDLSEHIFKKTMKQKEILEKFCAENSISLNSFSMLLRQYKVDLTSGEFGDMLSLDMENFGFKDSNEKQKRKINYKEVLSSMRSDISQLKKKKNLEEKSYKSHLNVEKEINGE